jgi:predicted phage tail protein
MGIYFQLYNLKIDDTTHKNNATIDFEIFQGDRSIKHVVQTSEQLHQSGEQMTVQESVPLENLPPGKYRINIKATDAVANQTVSRTSEFSVTPAAAQNTAAQAAPPR